MKQCPICYKIHDYKTHICATCRTRLYALRRALQGDGTVNVPFLNSLAASDYKPKWYHDRTAKMCVVCLKHKPYIHRDPTCRACSEAGWRVRVV